MGPQDFAPLKENAQTYSGYKSLVFPGLKITWYHNLTELLMAPSVYLTPLNCNLNAYATIPIKSTDPIGVDSNVALFIH